MKKILIPILIGFSLAAVSCQSLLDIPQKGVVSEDEFYDSDEDAQALLTNMYASLVGINGVAGCSGIYNPQLMILNYSADDILAAGGNVDDHLDQRVFDEFRYDNANPALLALYNGYETTDFAANLIISHFSTENVDGEEPFYSSDFTDQCVEEARVMRAYIHLMKALSWYAPTIVDRLLDHDELPRQAVDQKEVLSWVISECDKAIKSGKLPERDGTTDKVATARVSLGFAQFVAGKAAVFNNEMDKARKYLGDLIASGNYALTPSRDYWTLFHRAGDGNSEKIFAPNFVEDPNRPNSGFSADNPLWRSRWMVANTLCWKTANLASVPTVVEKITSSGGGWGGGAIQVDFAKKFLKHDGNSPRRKACFLTEEEWLYDLDWSGSMVNDGTEAQKKADPMRGISSQSGLFSSGPYFAWKHMVFHNPPKILTGGKEYPADNVEILGSNSNQTNFTLARYAEVLLLYAEACIGSTDAAKGLAALQAVQRRSGSGRISDKLTIENVIEEKQYELWFEGCRFHDLVRWSSRGFVDLNKIFNTSAIHEHVPTVSDAYFLMIGDEPAYPKYFGKEHKLVTSYSSAKFSAFTIGRNEYFPFPRDTKTANPDLMDVRGWEDFN